MNNENKLTQHNIDVEDALTSPLNCRVSIVNCLQNGSGYDVKATTFKSL